MRKAVEEYLEGRGCRVMRPPAEPAPPTLESLVAGFLVHVERRIFLALFTPVGMVRQGMRKQDRQQESGCNTEQERPACSHGGDLRKRPGRPRYSGNSSMPYIVTAGRVFCNRMI